MVLPPLIPLPYSVGPRIFSMPGEIENSHRICEYPKCIPKAFSTCVYVTTMLNPYPYPLPPYLFIHLLLESITEVLSPLFSTSVVDPLLSYI